LHRIAAQVLTRILGSASSKYPAIPHFALFFDIKWRIEILSLLLIMKISLIPSLLATALWLVAPSAAQQFTNVDPHSTPPGAPIFTAPPSTWSGQGNQATGRVTIIESQSSNLLHDMDVEWLAVASSMGFTAAIFPQSTLDTTAFFATTDILVVSSGIIWISGTAVANIQAFVAQGGQVYLQG
jgi:hypothetical protein